MNARWERPGGTEGEARVLAAREDFPILARPVRGKRLVYLDNGATTQKPAVVIEAEARFYRETNANIHRGVHTLSQLATDAYEAARKTVQEFINAAHADEIVFVRGATEGINLVASSWGRTNLKDGDEIIVSAMEHHSNLIPWQLLAEARDARLVMVELTPDGRLDEQSFRRALEGGCDSIEHGLDLSDWDIAFMKEHGIWYCPTLSVYYDHDAPPDTPAGKRDLLRIQARVQRAKAPLRGAAAIGQAVGAVIGKRKMAKHFDLSITDTAFSFTRRQDAIAAEARLDADDACGRPRIPGLLQAARARGLAARTVDLRNSGDTAGPRGEVVGYGAWVVE